MAANGNSDFFKKDGKREEDNLLTFIDKDSNLHRANNVLKNSREHQKCEKQVGKSCEKGRYVKIMLNGLKKIGCDTGLKEANIVCEPCDPKLYAAFDTDRKEIIICENNLMNQKFMDNILTHELIHGYDVCRVKYDKDNLEHLACTSIRVANLTGDCFFWKENFMRFRFGWKAHQQECVRNMAVKNMMCSKDVSEEKAREVVEKVFDACFHDFEPFPRIPP